MIRSPNSRTVTGAAHTNWSMFGARGPCLSPEDPPGGSGAPPASPPGGDPPAPPPAPAPAPTDVTFTPEQQAVINRLVGAARVEGRNAARPPTPAPHAPAPTPAPAEKPTIEGLAQLLAETQLRARFDKRAAKRGLDDDAADDLFELYKVHKPTDDENWFGEREKRLGLKAATTTPPATTQTTTTTTAPTIAVVPNTAPISDRGSPAPAGAIGWRHELQTVGAIGMSKAARDQMDAELGSPEKGRAQRMAASREQASRMRVVFGPNQKG